MCYVSVVHVVPPLIVPRHGDRDGQITRTDRHCPFDPDEAVVVVGEVVEAPRHGHRGGGGGEEEAQGV